MSHENTASESTSASLIERAREADGAAWQRVSKIYGPVVYRWCRRAGLQEADAADVIQEVFSAVLSRLVTYEVGREGGFRGWLYGITRHKVADHFRRGQATESLAGDVEAEWFASPPSASSGGEDSEPGDSLLVVRAVLEAIRPDFNDHNWQAFERTAMRGEPATEVAAEMNLTPTAVRQAKFRILRRLRCELDSM